MSGYDQLVDDLWAIYFAAGRGVTYVAADGERRACWDERYRMELELALADLDAVGFAERLVRGAEPSCGFARLRRARRLDLTIEALVANPNSPYHQLFDPDAVRTARERLDAAGYHAVIGPTGSAPGDRQRTSPPAAPGPPGRAPLARGLSPARRTSSATGYVDRAGGGVASEPGHDCQACGDG